ncbi:VacJ family lipoprotein [Desulfovibrio mangrovi]|uniref:MlaA family lipoprotein n=1 Tax=Desulfovibrio mangrovi TaxID=2976983 RepID=UPI002247B485|nr:VacJ family lipoprotein [Desulfovibrio mangrovi]UZP66985.1 VacJ family lipoprotein [Desulfovibrio mangrovi]
MRTLKQHNATFLHLTAAMLCLCMLTACGAKQIAPERMLEKSAFRTPVSHAVAPEMHDELNNNSMLFVNDPAERINRTIYTFNARLDRAVLIPVVTGYQAVVPPQIRSGVSNGISNINEIPRLANAMLQGNPSKSGIIAARFIINSTLGIGGLFDPATELEFYQQSEDFGQTLGVWGIPQGAYVVLPLYGPSSIRDTAGTAGDMLFAYYQMEYLYDLAEIDNRELARNTNTVVRGINTRSGIPFRYYTMDTPFEYEILRFAYMKARQLETER